MFKFPFLNRMTASVKSLYFAFKEIFVRKGVEGVCVCTERDLGGMFSFNFN